MPIAHSVAAPSAVHQTALKTDTTYTWNNIVFTQAGLPAGVTWSVFLVEWGYSLGNVTPTDTITFNVNASDNGTNMGMNAYGNYTWSVNSVAGFDAAITGGSGCVTVAGVSGYCNVTTASASVTVTFSTSGQYNVQFNESNLAAGTVWSVTFQGGTIWGAAPDPIVFGAQNGTYAFSIGGGGIPTANMSTPESGMLTVPNNACGSAPAANTTGCTVESPGADFGFTYQNISFWAFTPTGISASFTSTLSTNGLPYITLPYNITWTVSVTGPANVGINANFSQQLNATWLVSGCGPFTFPCLPLFQTPINPAWETHATATSGDFYFPLSLANLTGSTYLGFDLPQGQWEFSVWANYNDGIGNSSTFEVDQAAFVAATGPAGAISQPVANSNITVGNTVISGSYSGYFVATANVTVFNANHATVLTAPVYAPGTQNHPFAVAWPAITPGTYSVNLTLTAVWHQAFSFVVTVNVLPGLPVTYHNTTNAQLISGLSNGGSAALLVVLGAIIGMIVMAVVGRGMMGGPKPGPAQPWSSQSPPAGGTSGGSSGGGMSGGSSGGSGGMSDSSGGMGGSNPPS